jgi:hypothetical protein
MEKARATDDSGLWRFSAGGGRDLLSRDDSSLIAHRSSLIAHLVVNAGARKIHRFFEEGQPWSYCCSSRRVNNSRRRRARHGT